MARAPRATYRLQLNAQFGFDRAAELATYLRELGVSHLYASPYLQAVAGSQHGYDVVDHGKINRELGGEAGHARMSATLRAQGLGQLLDIVPNHMAIGTAENRYWWDVLENGPASRYADYFDVDWEASDNDRVLLPILGERYIDAIESRSVQIERAGERFLVRYHEHALPAAPHSIARVLHAAADVDASGELAFVADALQALLPPNGRPRPPLVQQQRDKRVLFEQLRRLLAERGELAQAVDQQLERLNGDVEALDAWLELQHFRLAYWKTAATDLGYRRFFDVTSLAGLRVEDAEVFASSHELILRLLQDGTLDGVRIDHPDGLRDPEQYLTRLRAAAPDAYVVVEKILEPGESLPASWPVDGTTGYDFMFLVDHVFLDPAGKEALDALAARFAGAPQDYAEMARAAKLQILNEVLPSERGRLADLAHRVLVAQRALRDCTRHEAQTAVTELLASFPHYRTYLRAGAAPAAADVALIEGALATAAARQPEIDARVWSGLRDLLLQRPNSALANEFALRMQQVTSAVAAKAIEDTLFYRYLRLVALNEVGGNPERFDLSLEAFHAALAQRSHPHSLLGSATHDHKRGEDMRARLLTLSEIPDVWTRCAERLSARSQRYRADVVDGATEYFFYQTLVGAYPLSAERAWAYMHKAIREAKLGTSWTRPDPGYEAAVENFVRGALNDRELMENVREFVERIAEAGFVTGLGRTLIKLTAPGVPDLYQGCELWDFSLVDPDNRRPVDFAQRRAQLARLPKLAPADALAELEFGTPKLWLIWKTLDLRRERPERFSGSYFPLRMTGADADSAIAFAREGGIATVVPRFFARKPLAERKATVVLPEGEFRNVLTGERVAGEVPLARMLARFPVALLEREP